MAVPAYLPAEARAVVPWARSHVTRLAAKHPDRDLGDLWDEVIRALLRATVHFTHERGTFRAYAQTAISRGLWRYALPSREVRKHPSPRVHNTWRPTVSFERVEGEQAAPTWWQGEENGAAWGVLGDLLTRYDLTAPSAEDEAVARETVRDRLTAFPAAAAEEIPNGRRRRRTSQGVQDGDAERAAVSLRR